VSNQFIIEQPMGCQKADEIHRSAIRTNDQLFGETRPRSTPPTGPYHPTSLFDA